MNSKIKLCLISLLSFACAHTTSPPSNGNTNRPLSELTGEIKNEDQIAKLINSGKTEKFSSTLPLDVYFATNRKFSGQGSLCGNDSFAITPGEETIYGVCRVNVPKNHATGKIEFSSDDSADPNKYFKILSQKNFDFENFQKAVQKTPRNEVLVFVHGFNVKFQDAVLRASQLAYDLKFQGHIVLFSWPAGAEDGLLSTAMIAKTYKANRDNAKQSVKNAIDFFDLFSRLGLKVNIYVHSMGHQVVIPALVELSKNTDIKLLVHELILNAPDFDLKEFVGLAPSLLKLADRITLYCSYNDSAMTASESVNGGARLGACEAVSGVDVINVSEIDNPSFGMGLGHSYYSSRAVLTDVAQLMMGIDAENRIFIRRSEKNAKENFFLRP